MTELLFHMPITQTRRASESLTPRGEVTCLRGMIVFLVLVAAVANPVRAADKPNVLFIAIDDMNDWTTLFDDDNPIQTPNLKRLAERGCFFSQAYCASPGCNPSRTAILTGYRPTTSGVYGNPEAWRLKVPDAITLPQYFERKRRICNARRGKDFSSR